MDISPSATTLRQLVGLERVMVIPTFQRGYEWEREQIDDFWESVQNSVDGDMPFFGPMVTLTTTGEPHQVDVIDGQQRLTTVILTLSLLRDWIANQPSPLLAKGTEHQQNVGTAVRAELFFLNSDGVPDSTQPRFRAAERIRTVFNERVILDPPRSSDLMPGGAGMSPRQREETKDLRRAKKLLWAKISAYLNGSEEHPQQFRTHDERMRAVLRLRKALLDDFEIYTLNLTSEDDAYVLFESLNNRGLRLNPADILRTISLRGVRSEFPNNSEKLDDAIARWTQVAENLGEHDTSAFLRHFLLAASNVRIQKKKVIESFKSRLAANSSYQEVKTLETATEKYRLLLPPRMHPLALLESDGLRTSSAALNLLNDTHRIPLLAVLLKDSNATGLTLRNQERFFRAIEALTFRWLLKGGNAQELETIYQDVVHKMRDSRDAINADLDYELGTRLVLEKLPSNVDIQGFPRTERHANLRYVLFRTEVIRGAGLPPRWTDSEGTLEHLAPQSATQYWTAAIGPEERSAEDTEAEQTYSDLVQYWGNLCLLEAKLNKSIKNADWPTKKAGNMAANGDIRHPGLNGSSFRGTGDVAKQESWTREHLLQRTEWLAKLALELVSPEWVQNGRNPTQQQVTWSLASG